MPTSLISIMAGVFVAGLIAALAVPSSQGVMNQRLEETTWRLADLLTLAKRRSMETGDTYGLRWTAGTATFDVIRADVTTLPATVLGTEVDPVSKQPARLVLDNGVAFIGGMPFTFTGLGAQETVYFDNWATPFNRFNAGRAQLAGAQLTLSYNGATRSVTLRPVSGAVVVN
ncbi:MAG: hypothetical protein H6993_17960 [Pseudomonadales bacterium]|nr:hypothetical protein [Pseudomonadales bacterium]MCP5185855.1 hypothetical protein [Pseudomonadales bacterium]